MPLINGRKVACEPCIRGHRATTCDHEGQRLMLPVRKPGRPLSSCPHLPGDNCACTITVAIPRKRKCPCTASKAKAKTDLAEQVSSKGAKSRKTGSKENSPERRNGGSPALEASPVKSCCSSGQQAEPMVANGQNGTPSQSTQKLPEIGPKRPILLPRRKTSNSESGSKEQPRNGTSCCQSPQSSEQREGETTARGSPENSNPRQHQPETIVSRKESINTHPGHQPWPSAAPSPAPNLYIPNRMGTGAASYNHVDNHTNGGARIQPQPLNSRSNFVTPINHPVTPSSNHNAPFNFQPLLIQPQLQLQTDSQKLLCSNCSSHINPAPPYTPPHEARISQPPPMAAGHWISGEPGVAYFVFPYPYHPAAQQQTTTAHSSLSPVTATPSGEQVPGSTANGNVFSMAPNQQSPDPNAWPQHDCECGPTCQCLGCLSHPYNTATREYVRNAYQTLRMQNEEGMDSSREDYGGGGWGSMAGNGNIHHPQAISHTNGNGNGNGNANTAGNGAVSTTTTTGSSPVMPATNHGQGAGIGIAGHGEWGMLEDVFFFGLNEPAVSEF